MIRELRIHFVVRDHLGSVGTLITSEGAVDAAVAVREIARGSVAYVTGPDSWARTRVTTLSGLGGDYLFANWDGTGRNNLHDLAAAPATIPSACVHVRPRRPGLWTRMRGMIRRG